MLEEQRESWGTRGGFVLAAVGSAVGLGNLWGFPYKLYSYGGGAFLLPYIVAMFCIGIPMLIMEFSLGHFTQRAAPDAYRRVNKRTEFVGWWAILLGFVIITYYPIILAYCFSFIWYSLVGIANGGQLPWAGEGIEGVKLASDFFFGHYLNMHDSFELGSFQWHLFWPLVITWVCMYFCIFKGVNLVDKIVWITVPLPWIMLFILAVRGLTLPGQQEGLAFFLNPDWTQLLEPTTWRYAFGQVFFSLSLAFGVMLTYASFLHRKSDINNNAAIIGIADFATSFIAGIAVFATLGGMSYVTAQQGNPVPVEEVVKGGPGLAFVAFPYALAQLPGSAWWSLIFFFTLITLGIDSAFSITEGVLAGIVDKTGWPRWIVLPVLSVIGIVTGLFYCTQGGLNWLGTIDGFINGTWGIAFIGMLECIILGWVYRTETLREHANQRSDWKLPRLWNYLIRIVIPVVLGTLFFWSLFDDLTADGGFLKGPDGWKIQNCVGLGVMALVPAAAIILSVIKSPVRGFGSIVSETEMLKTPFPIRRILAFAGFIPAVLSLVTTIVYICLLVVYKSLTTGTVSSIVVFEIVRGVSLALAVVSLIVSNICVEHKDNIFERPSWFARWGGMISTVIISAWLALFLIIKTAAMQAAADSAEHVEKSHQLSSVSFVIMTVVFILIVGGLGWCFYKALAAVPSTDEQHEDEI